MVYGPLPPTTVCLGKLCGLTSSFWNQKGTILSGGRLKGKLAAKSWPTQSLLITLTPQPWLSGLLLQDRSQSTQATRQRRKRGLGEGVVGGRLPGTSIYRKGVHTRANLRVRVPKTRVMSIFGQCYKPPDPEIAGENRLSPKTFRQGLTILQGVFLNWKF